MEPAYLQVVGISMFLWNEMRFFMSLILVTFCAMLVGYSEPLCLMLFCLITADTVSGKTQLHQVLNLEHFCFLTSKLLCEDQYLPYDECGSDAMVGIATSDSIIKDNRRNMPPFTASMMSIWTQFV